MKKPIKLVYKIEATNGRVYVRYIMEDSYETNKNSTSSWNLVSHIVADLSDTENPKKKTVYTDFSTGEKAEQFILSEIQKYEDAFKQYQADIAEIVAEKKAHNDNIEKLLHDEKIWREVNMNGKLYK